MSSGLLLYALVASSTVTSPAEPAATASDRAAAHLATTVASSTVASASVAPDLYRVIVRGSREEHEDRAESRVTRRDLDRRLPRSAPDAVRFEPGVFVQQTAHGQGSAFIRGLTGQQTVLAFDGVRMNNATYRQGPNQYLFTLDARTLREIAIERGGASTRWGSDALGGVIDARPIEPELSAAGLELRPRVLGRWATADHDLGGRLELQVSTPHLAVLGGVGLRDVGLLEGPPVLNPSPTTDAGLLPWVPRYAEYDPTRPVAEQLDRLRTQLGTGFRELTADARLRYALAPGATFTLAGYLYRETDAPRTDQCPPPTAPWDQCLTYEEQFRHLVYATWSGSLGPLGDRARVTLSWQEQHERRRLDLTAANLVGHGTDDVETFGLLARVGDLPLTLFERIARLRYGLDAYLDWVRSEAEHRYTDTGDVVAESRGQYLDGSLYLQGGGWAELELDLTDALALRGGARLGLDVAHAPGDPTSGSAPVERTWGPLVGHVGLGWSVTPSLELLADVDHSYRAPNLDDLTSRQQTGPGFQFESPTLGPERATSFEAGLRFRTAWLGLDVWAFETLLDGAILKVSRTAAECPANTPQCQGSWSRFQLENAPSLSELRGTEGRVRLALPGALSLRATIAWVWSEGPRVGALAQGTTNVTLGERVPLSRTPPLNGTVELAWGGSTGLSVGAGLQWAAEQDRLAIADLADGRIPKYGTPAFAVLQLRAGYRLGERLAASVVLENLLDTPYRFHGSSINGAGRGLIAQLELSELL